MRVQHCTTSSLGATLPATAGFRHAARPSGPCAAGRHTPRRWSLLQAPAGRWDDAGGAVQSSGGGDLSDAELFRDDPLADPVGERRSNGSGESAALERELVGVRAALARTQADAEGLADRLLQALTQQQAEAERVAQLTQLLEEERAHSARLQEQAFQASAAPDVQALREANDSLRSLMAERQALQAELGQRDESLAEALALIDQLQGRAVATADAPLAAAEKLLAALEAAEADRDAAAAAAAAERARADAATAAAAAAEEARMALADRALAAWETSEVARRERDLALEQLQAMKRRAGGGPVPSPSSTRSAGAPASDAATHAAAASQLAAAMVAAMAAQQGQEGEGRRGSDPPSDVVERLRRRNASRDI